MGMAATCAFVYKGELLVGLDIAWKLGQVHGHARHRWIEDDLECGQRVAESHAHATWLGPLERQVAYEFTIRGYQVAS